MVGFGANGKIALRRKIKRLARRIAYLVKHAAHRGCVAASVCGDARLNHALLGARRAVKAITPAACTASAPAGKPQACGRTISSE
jgi:hypothetical protein